MPRLISSSNSSCSGSEPPLASSGSGSGSGCAKLVSSTAIRVALPLVTVWTSAVVNPTVMWKSFAGRPYCDRQVAAAGQSTTRYQQRLLREAPHFAREPSARSPLLQDLQSEQPHRSATQEPCAAGLCLHAAPPRARRRARCQRRLSVASGRVRCFRGIPNRFTLILGPK